MDLMTWKQREKLGHLHRVENESHKKKNKKQTQSLYGLRQVHLDLIPLVMDSSVFGGQC